MSFVCIWKRTTTEFTQSAVFMQIPTLLNSVNNFATKSFRRIISSVEKYRITKRTPLDTLGGLRPTRCQRRIFKFYAKLLFFHAKQIRIRLLVIFVAIHFHASDRTDVSSGRRWRQQWRRMNCVLLKPTHDMERERVMWIVLICWNRLFYLDFV